MTEPRYPDLQTSLDQGVLVLTITATQLSDWDLCNRLRHELVDAWTRSPVQKVVLDFGRVEFISSVAFTPLISLLRKVEAAGGRIVLCNLSPPIEAVFRVTRFLLDPQAATGLFDYAPDVPLAQAMLNAGQQRK